MSDKMIEVLLEQTKTYNYRQQNTNCLGWWCQIWYLLKLFLTKGYFGIIMSVSIKTKGTNKGELKCTITEKKWEQTLLNT